MAVPTTFSLTSNTAAPTLSAAQRLLLLDPAGRRWAAGARNMTTPDVPRRRWAAGGSLPHLASLALGMWRRGGARGVVGAVRMRLRDDLRFVRFHVDLAEWTLAPRVIPDGVEVREGRLDELRRYRRAHRDLPLAFSLDETHGARRFYVAMVGGAIGHISWVFTSAERPLHMTLAPGDILLDGAHTPPEFRGRGLLSAVERAILDDAAAEGRRHAYTHVAVDNVPSIRGVLRTGFRPIGLVHRRWRLGVPLVRYDADPRALAALMAQATGTGHRAA